MIRYDESALRCDLAETYHIFDYKSLPPKLVATFSIGLGINSRIKKKMRGDRVGSETILLATLIDQMSALLNPGTEARVSMLEQLNGSARPTRLGQFSTPEEYEEARRRAIEQGEK